LTTGEHLQRAVTIIGIWGGVVAPLLFLVQYTWIARWWRTSNGRLIVALDICICLARIPRLRELAHGSYHFDYNWVEVLATLAIPSIILWRMWVFEKKRRQKRSARYAREQVLAQPQP